MAMTIEHTGYREPKRERVMEQLDKDLIGFTYAHRFNFNIEYFNAIAIRLRLTTVHTANVQVKNV